MSVDAYFTGLNKRQTMLLLTALTFGGSESGEVFDFLSPDEAELLKHRAQEIVKVPRDKRVPLLVSEIKRLVTARRGQLWSADPELLAAVLRRERRGLVEVILRALPAGLADEVRAQLPPSGAVLTCEVKPEILDIVRWKLEEALAKEGGGKALFKFSDLALLNPRELIALCDRLGVRGLGTAIAGLPEEERRAFLDALPPDQRKLSERAVAAFADRALATDDARALVALHGGDTTPSEAIRSAGAQRIARACLAQSPEFAARVLERHTGELGRLLTKWVREERPRVTKGADAGRTDIVAELERLEAKGVIDKPVRPYPAKPRSAAPSSAPGPLPGGKVVPPRPSSRAPEERGRPERRDPTERRERSGQEERRERAGQGEARERAPAGAPRRRDFMAEREARRAGAASSRVEDGPSRGPDKAPDDATVHGRARPPLPVTAPRPPRDRAERPGDSPRSRPGGAVLGRPPRLKKPPGNSR